MLIKSVIGDGVHGAGAGAAGAAGGAVGSSRVASRSAAVVGAGAGHSAGAAGSVGSSRVVSRAMTPFRVGWPSADGADGVEDIWLQLASAIAHATRSPEKSAFIRMPELRSKRSADVSHR